MKCSPDRVQMVQNRLMWIISFVMKLFGTVQNGIRLNQAKWSPIMTHIMLIIPKPIRLQLLRMLALLIWPLGGAIYIAVQNIPSDFALANLAQFLTDWPIMCYNPFSSFLQSRNWFSCHPIRSLDIDLTTWPPKNQLTTWLRIQPKIVNCVNL